MCVVESRARSGADYWTSATAALCPGLRIVQSLCQSARDGKGAAQLRQQKEKGALWALTVFRCFIPRRGVGAGAQGGGQRQDPAMRQGVRIPGRTRACYRRAYREGAAAAASRCELLRAGARQPLLDRCSTAAQPRRPPCLSLRSPCRQQQQQQQQRRGICARVSGLALLHCADR